MRIIIVGRKGVGGVVCKVGDREADKSSAYMVVCELLIKAPHMG